MLSNKTCEFYCSEKCWLIVENLSDINKKILMKNGKKVAGTGEKYRSSRSSCYWLKYPERLSHRNNWLRVVYIWVLSYGEKNNNNNKNKGNK